MSDNNLTQLSLKRFFVKSIIVFLLFLLVFVVSLFTSLPMYFDSYVQIENYRLEAHIYLIAYRIVMYFSFPFVISLFESVKRKREEKYSKLLIENFNVQFATYAIMASLYVILGLDKLLSEDIFSNADTFLFMTGFIITTIINRGIPDLLATK